MKMQAPEGTSSVSVGGVNIPLDKNGQCEVEGAEALEALVSHGFTPAVEAAEAAAKPALKKK